MASSAISSSWSFFLASYSFWKYVLIIFSKDSSRVWRLSAKYCFTNEKEILRINIMPNILTIFNFYSQKFYNSMWHTIIFISIARFEKVLNLFYLIQSKLYSLFQMAVKSINLTAFDPLQCLTNITNCSFFLVINVNFLF